MFYICIFHVIKEFIVQYLYTCNKSGAKFLKKSHLPEKLPGTQICLTVWEIAFSNFYPDGDLCRFFINQSSDWWRHLSYLSKWPYWYILGIFLAYTWSQFIDFTFYLKSEYINIHVVWFTFKVNSRIFYTGVHLKIFIYFVTVKLGYTEFLYSTFDYVQHGYIQQFPQKL